MNFNSILMVLCVEFIVKNANVTFLLFKFLQHVEKCKMSESIHFIATVMIIIMLTYFTSFKFYILFYAVNKMLQHISSCLISQTSQCSSFCLGLLSPYHIKWLG